MTPSATPSAPILGIAAIATYIPDDYLDNLARAAALDAWLGQHFDEAEQRRIRSLESIGEL